MCDQTIAGIPLCSCGCRLAYTVWLAIPVILIFTSIQLSAEPDNVQRLKKQFGLGVGPSFVEYHQLESGLLRRRAYEAYFGYRKWTQQMSETEVESYRSLYARNKCAGGCGLSALSDCVRGHCECRQEVSNHRYGNCWEMEKTFSQFEKLRQSPPPTEAPVELPSHCYLDPAMNVLDQLQQHKPECAEQKSAAEEVTPSPVDWSNVRCGEREECPDINMVCGPTFTCQCRQDMRWSQASLQCELYLDTDCRQETHLKVETGFRDHLLSKTPHSPPPLQEGEIKSLYCNVLEEIWREHVEEVRGWIHPKHLNYFTTGGIVALIAGIIFFSFDLLMITNYIKLYIRSFDPVFQMQTMSRAEKFMVLGSLAASEAAELREEARDEARTAMMQTNL